MFIPYKKNTQLFWKQWNNTFGYDQRMLLKSNPVISLPEIKYISDIFHIKTGTSYVIHEIDSTWSIISEKWLANIYDYSSASFEKKRIIIMDNHNHALFFRTQELIDKKHQNISITHIDQHSDLNSPNKYIQLPTSTCDLWEYTNYICEISTFIKPFLDRFPSTDFRWIKSEYDYLSHKDDLLTSSKKDWKIKIVDIDCDFRAPEMSIEKFDETITLTKQLIIHADIVTIATSPLFIDQDNALSIIHKLFV